jgi:hypothetical protein
MAPPPVSTNGDTILTAGILKEGSLTITVPSYGVNIHRYECGAAARRELLIIPEIIVVAFDSEPVFEVKSVSRHDSARVRWLVGDPPNGGLLLEETGPLNCHLMSDFLSRG